MSGRRTAGRAISAPQPHEEADMVDATKPPADAAEHDATRRRLLKTSALSIAAAGVYGVTPFFGPWKHNHAWAQSAQKKPLIIGLTMDASGQYAASGGEERLGAMMAIKEFNDKGGVLGRRIEALHMD